MSDITRVIDIINAPNMKSLKLLAGKKGVQAPIGYVTVMEVPDIVRWLKGNEFIVTSFYACKDDVDVQCKVVKEMAKRGCAGMAIKTGQYIKEIDRRVLEIADELEFPIIQIPYKMSYIEIINEIFMLIQRGKEYKNLREKYLKEIVKDEASNDLETIQKGLLFELDLRNFYFNSITIGINKSDLIENDTLERDKYISLLEKYKSEKTYILGKINTENRCTIFFYGLDEDALFKIRNKIADKLDNVDEDKHNVKIAIGGTYFGISGIRKTYLESNGAYLTGIAFFPKEFIYKYEEIEVFCVIRELFSNYSIYSMEDLVKKIGNEDLMETLICYFDKDGVTDEVSTALYIHRNTVSYRLSRIYEITGLDVKRYKDSFILYVLALYYRLQYHNNENSSFF